MKTISTNLATIKKVFSILLEKYRDDIEVSGQLRSGFIPNELKDEYNELVIENPATEQTSFDEYLYDNAFRNSTYNKFVEQTKGSGYINPINSRLASGVSFDDLYNSVMANTIGDANIVKNNLKITSPKPSAETASSNTDVANKLVKIIAKTESKVSVSVSASSSSELRNVPENIEFYKKNKPNLTDNHIKAWVHYKRANGSPMLNWEKYYLPTVVDNNGAILVYANETAILYNKESVAVKLATKDGYVGRFLKQEGVYLEVITETNDTLYIDHSKATKKKNKYSVNDSILMDLVKQKCMCFINNEYIPIPIFTFGNLFDIEDTVLGKYNKETDRKEGGEYEKIESKFGKEIADWHLELLNGAKLRNEFLKFNNEDKNNRPYLSIYSDIAFTEYEFSISEYGIDAGLMFNRDTVGKKYQKGDKFTLRDAFFIYFKNKISLTDVKTVTHHDIAEYFFKPVRLPSDKIDGKTDQRLKDIRDKLKVVSERAIQEGQSLFSDFLAKALTFEDVTKLNVIWNRRFNNSPSTLDYSLIPTGFINNKYAYELLPAQIDGVSFLSVNGSGLLSYDVGYGKTLCGIHNIATQMTQGDIKRPLIVVPKATVQGWINESFGYWKLGSEKFDKEVKGSKFVAGALTGTGITLNFLGNVTDLANKGKVDLTKEVPANSITIVTYEGLKKMGFSNGVYTEIESELCKLLETPKTTSGSERDKEINKAKSEAKIYDVQKGSICDFDKLGFDHITVDECHNMKNVFGKATKNLNADKNEVKEGKRQVNQFDFDGSYSTLGIKGMAFCSYINMRYSKGVTLLSATPFTNSPLEIYTMLMLINPKSLKDRGIHSAYDFCEQFIAPVSDYVVTFKNKLEVKSIVKSFMNTKVMNDIIFKSIDRKDDPIKAEIRRPCKIKLPTTKILTSLEMSDFQKRINLQIIEKLDHPRESLKCIGMLKKNSISPHLVTSDDEDKIPEGGDMLTKIIADSPKIKYVVECIDTVKNWHEERGQECSGQIIFSNFGIKLFGHIKTYLERRCGFEKDVKFGSQTVDEVSIITSMVSDDERETIKNAFNAGYVKVILGTSVIKEGVNLQERGTVLYIMDLGWNPTDFQQLEGRIHRQGNKFGYVRVVVPMVKNTLDSFIYQKLQEKEGRISSIWADKSKLTSNSIDDYEPLDLYEIKLQLITDVEELVKVKLEKEISDSQMRLDNDAANVNNVNGIDVKIQSYLREMKSIKEDSYLSDVEARLNYFAKETKDETNKLEAIAKKYGTQKEFDGVPMVEITGATGAIKKNNDTLTKLAECLSLFKQFRENDDCYALLEGVRKVSWAYTFNRYYILQRMMQSVNQKVDSWDISRVVDDNTRQYYSDIKDVQRSFLTPYGKVIGDDISEIKSELEQKFKESKVYNEYVNSKEHAADVKEQVRVDVASRDKDKAQLMDRVEQFASLNYLLSYPFDCTQIITAKDAVCIIPDGEFTGECVTGKEEVVEDAETMFEINTEGILLERSFIANFVLQFEPENSDANIVIEMI